MHIAIFIYGLTGGGAQRRTLTLANAFSHRGHRVDLVVANADGPLTASVPNSVRLVPLNSRLLGLLRLKRLRRLKISCSQWALAQYLRCSRPDVLLSAASHVNLAAIRARSLSGLRIPLVVRISNHLTASHLHTFRPFRRLRYLSACRLYQRANAVITVSAGLADDIALSAGVSPKRITTIYNPIYTPGLIEKASAHLDHPWFKPGSPPVILGVGRLAASKDFPTLVKAFAEVHRIRPVHLVILGEGKKRRKILALAQSLNVAEDIDLPGFVNNPLAWMGRASLFVLSSAWEGLPGVLIEAMAAGCPVISTDCPSGPAEILENGKYGQLVPVGNYEALAKAIIANLKSPLEPEKLRARASEFSVDKAADKYLEVLSSVVQEKSYLKSTILAI